MSDFKIIATYSDGGELSNYTLTKQKHTKTLKDLWVATLKQNVPADKWRALRKKVESKGGYYSSFVKGFIFNEEPSIELLDSLFSETSRQESALSNSEKSELNEENNHRVFIVHRSVKSNTEFDNLTEQEAHNKYEQYINDSDSEIVTWDKSEKNQYGMVTSVPTIKMKIIKDLFSKGDRVALFVDNATKGTVSDVNIVSGELKSIDIDWDFGGVAEVINAEDFKEIIKLNETKQQPTENLIIGFTSAPESYDGFGTKTISDSGYLDDKGKKAREISIPEKNYDWQTLRYKSGNYGFFTKEEFDKYKGSIFVKPTENKLSGVIFSTDEKGNHVAAIKDVKYKKGITDLKIQFKGTNIVVIYGKKQGFDGLRIKYSNDENICISGSTDGGYCDIEINYNKALAIFKTLYDLYLKDNKFEAVVKLGSLILDIEKWYELNDFKSQFTHKHTPERKINWELTRDLNSNKIISNLDFIEVFEDDSFLYYFKDDANIKVAEQLEEQLIEKEKQKQEQLSVDYPDIIVNDEMSDILKALANQYNKQKPSDRQFFTSRFYLSLAGDYNQDRRIAIIQALTGEKVPAYKAGIGAMQEHLDKWLKKMIESAKFVKTDDKPIEAENNLTEKPKEENPITIYDKFDSGLLNDWRRVGGSPISVLKELDRLKKVGQAIYRSGVATYSAIISGLSDRDLKIIEAIKKEYNWNDEVAKTEQKPAVEEKQVYSEQAEESPMVKKYNSLKAKYPEAVLWFRIGDFYETYKEDAIKTANELGTILTKDEGGVQKTGFPAHSLDNYLPKMVKSGIKVAVADELENPKAKEEVVENPIDEVISTVRDLANKEAELQEGLLSGAFFSSLEKGDIFTVGKKNYTVESISKPKPQEYIKKGETVKYSKNSIRIKGDKGEVVSGEFWQYGNGNSAWLGKGQTKKQDKWGQLSRDIEGDITIDLINENNDFHEKSDSYKKVQEYIGKRKQEVQGLSEQGFTDIAKQVNKEIKKYDCKITKITKAIDENKKHYGYNVELSLYESMGERGETSSMVFFLSEPNTVESVVGDIVSELKRIQSGLNEIEYLGAYEEQHLEILNKVLSDKGKSNQVSEKDQIRVLANGIYQKKIDNGEMTAEQVIKILNNAGVEVPQSIKDRLNSKQSTENHQEQILRKIEGYELAMEFADGNEKEEFQRKIDGYKLALEMGVFEEGGQVKINKDEATLRVFNKIASKVTIHPKYEKLVKAVILEAVKGIIDRNTPFKTGGFEEGNEKAFKNLKKYITPDFTYDEASVTPLTESIIREVLNIPAPVIPNEHYDFKYYCENELNLDRDELYELDIYTPLSEKINNECRQICHFAKIIYNGELDKDKLPFDLVQRITDWMDEFEYDVEYNSNRGKFQSEELKYDIYSSIPEDYYLIVNKYGIENTIMPETLQKGTELYSEIMECCQIAIFTEEERASIMKIDFDQKINNEIAPNKINNQMKPIKQLISAKKDSPHKSINGKKIGGHQMSEEEYNELREKEYQLLQHARSMTYKYNDMKTAIKEGASKEDRDKWIEFSDFIKKYDTNFHHEAQVRFAIMTKLPVSKSAFMSRPNIVKELEDNLISGELKKEIQAKYTPIQYVKTLLENSGLLEKAKADRSSPLAKAVKELFPDEKGNKDKPKSQNNEVQKYKNIIEGYELAITMTSLRKEIDDFKNKIDGYKMLLELL
jgi:hypothetical protein